MSNKKIKITVDIFMLLFIVLSLLRWDDDPTFHTGVGVTCALFFAVHVLLNKKQLKSMARSYKKLSNLIKLKYWVNLLLMVVWCVSIISGLFALQFYTDEIRAFGRIHGVFSRIGCVLILVHIFQHRSQIISYIKGVKTPCARKKSNTKALK